MVTAVRGMLWLGSNFSELNNYEMKLRKQFHLEQHKNKKRILRDKFNKRNVKLVF